MIKILHIENDAGIRELVRAVLQREGIMVYSTDSIEDTINDILVVHKVNLAILGTKLPGGESMFSRLPELKKTLGDDVPIVATSGDPDYAKEWQNLVDKGDVFAFLAKPFNVAALEKAVADALGLKETDEQTICCPDCRCKHPLTECCPA